MEKLRQIRSIEELQEIINKNKPSKEEMNEDIEFPSLNAKFNIANKKNIVQPVFFIPAMDSDRGNVIQNNGEPLGEIAIPMAMHDMCFNKSYNYYERLVDDIIQQCICMIFNNMAIIFNSGIIAELEPFVIDNSRFIDIVNIELYMKSNHANMEIYNHFDSINRDLHNLLHNGKLNQCSVILSNAIATTKNIVANTLGVNTHDFIRTILVSKVIDIDAYFNAYYKYTDHNKDIVPDKFSVAMQMLLDTAIVDIMKIADMAELSAVSAFYQLTDSLHIASQLPLDEFAYEIPETV